ncbi:mitochondrial import inner membrane translocase subunit TIM10 [Syncephalis pseudoplumigaleata]|uniref:Mitochondrial import inner membrane translocase subunit n=1 Tax=Syncephalis pseudoplumigaleata TaxID=1712513 RepID=A0A4P9Z1J8_9FUNG|nr:mitochondrial import inner membrane translocase subunit TIM10 [Syncephalis pseudoplumigaleata]|eukprot:RKP26314.1 mitochondrial import inner membrane translocase subunit TIM10 [Syncephalis pseudoplumigaleata]
MSYMFGGNTGAGSALGQSQGINPNNIAMAEQELDMLTDTFNRIVDVCHTKCIKNKYPDGELTKGESVCIDRCVSKFFALNKTVGEKLMAQQQEMQK